MKLVINTGHAAECELGIVEQTLSTFTDTQAMFHRQSSKQPFVLRPTAHKIGQNHIKTVSIKSRAV